MKYTLIGSPTSPYVRKLRLLFHQKLDYQFKAINYLEINDAQLLKDINPINKIPILLIDDKPLYDSRVIFNHLSRTIGHKELNLEEENILSAIDGALDTAINLFCLRRDGLKIDDHSVAYLDRQIERIPLILNYLTPWVAKLDADNVDDWNYLSMSMYAFLEWAKFRDIVSLNPYPELNEFLMKFNSKPGLAETAIPR